MRDEAMMICNEVAEMLADMRRHIEDTPSATQSEGCVMLDLSVLDRERTIEALATVAQNFRPQIVRAGEVSPAYTTKQALERIRGIVDRWESGASEDGWTLSARITEALDKAQP